MVGKRRVKNKPAPVPPLAGLLCVMSFSDLMLLRESCASCSIEGNPTAAAAGRALDKFISGSEMAYDADAKALHSLLLSMRAKS